METKTEQKTNNPQREKLKAISKIIKKQLESGTLPPKYAGCNTINEVIQRSYEITTGQNIWNSFHGWKVNGYTINKGERGFPVWSRPAGKQTEESDEADTEDTETKPNHWASYRVAYIFHAGQVSLSSERGRAKQNEAAPTPKPKPPVPQLPPPAQTKQEEQLILF
jgi:hypothetical protein